MNGPAPFIGDTDAVPMLVPKHSNGVEPVVDDIAGGLLTVNVSITEQFPLCPVTVTACGPGVKATAGFVVSALSQMKE